MKLNIIAIAALTIFSFKLSPSQAHTIENSTTLQAVASDRNEIEYENLPNAVKISFEGSEYSDWKIGRAYEVDTDGFVLYEISISNGNDARIITYDADGNRMG
ncbi:hypothetical protein PZB74_11330 [Porifericola rhodea]|uniref:hypothetical protein n=1 Tax=Porifericola rhodea TaxID=930972 RepID=UPI0026654C5E|nr:hypothetical protein [Porifericola rhodea]WKN29555.1 hypothetical protein PZB74_11330 [Porifericola rhodea]